MGSRVRVSSGPPNKERVKLKVESGEKDVHFPLSVLTFPLVLGLLGFDSRDNGFVSMQADAPEALKTDAKQ